MQTIVLTGASGFIAKHILLKLLERGHRVRAGLRSPGRAGEVRAALSPHLPAAAFERLAFVPLDLEKDEGWAAALAGADALVHTASPFPLVQPADPGTLIRPAVEGTLRALRAAAGAGVGRVVLTSSSAAITNAALPAGKAAYDETVLTDPAYPTNTPYTLSKTQAERAAWDFAAAHPALRLTAINPALVLGPPLDAHYGTSLRLVERMMKAADPAVPPVAFGVVDVRDVAEAHVRALERPGTAGGRFLMAAGTLWFAEMAAALRAAFPGRRIVTRQAPAAVIRLLALFDRSIRTVVPILGRFERLDSSRARAALSLDFRPAREAVVAAGRWLADSGRV